MKNDNFSLKSSVHNLADTSFEKTNDEINVLIQIAELYSQENHDIEISAPTN